MHKNHWASAPALTTLSILAGSTSRAAEPKADEPAAPAAASARAANSPASAQKGAAQNEADDADAQHHAALGISLNDQGDRVRVIAVLPASPAARAGIQSGDEITSVGGQRVRTAEQLTDEILERSPGATVELGIRRNGQRQTVKAKLVSLDTLRRRGRSNSADDGSWRDRDRSARQLRAMQQQIARLEAQVDELRARRGPGGNGDNSWYYEEGNPDDANQGIHDYGARARDGQ